MIPTLCKLVSLFSVGRCHFISFAFILLLFLFFLLLLFVSFSLSGQNNGFHYDIFKHTGDMTVLSPDLMGEFYWFATVLDFYKDIPYHVYGIINYWTLQAYDFQIFSSIWRMLCTLFVSSAVWQFLWYASSCLCIACAFNGRVKIDHCQYSICFDFEFFWFWYCV